MSSFEVVAKPVILRAMQYTNETTAREMDRLINPDGNSLFAARWMYNGSFSGAIIFPRGSGMIGTSVKYGDYVVYVSASRIQVLAERAFKDRYHCIGSEGFTATICGCSK